MHLTILEQSRESRRERDSERKSDVGGGIYGREVCMILGFGVSGFFWVLFLFPIVITGYSIKKNAAVMGVFEI